MAEETDHDILLTVAGDVKHIKGEVSKIKKAVEDQNGRIDKLESFRDKVKGAGWLVGLLAVAAGVLIKVL